MKNEKSLLAKQSRWFDRLLKGFVGCKVENGDYGG